MSKVVGETTSIFRSSLFGHGEPVTMETGRTIFKQGGLGKYFYYIVEGQIELQFYGQSRRILKEGDFFGEIRILGNIPRTATATCLTPCQLMKLSAEQLNHLILEIPAVKKKIMPNYEARLMASKIRPDQANSRLKDSDFQEILSPFEHVFIPEYQYLISQGANSDAFYLILRGSVEVIRDGEVAATLGPGDFVGEIGVLYRIPRTADVFATGMVELLECRSDKVSKLLSDFPPLDHFLTDLAAQRLRRSR